MSFSAIGRGLVAPIVLLCAVASGCASSRSGLGPVMDRLARGDVEAALESLERSPRENDALYHLERGTLLRAVDRLDESNRAFDDADRIAEDLYTRSLTNEAAALVTSDRVRPYRPAPYERLLARVYQARNYGELGDASGALVEARRIERLLDEMQDEANGEVRTFIPAAHATAALLQEAGGRPEDALRMYRRLCIDAQAAGVGASGIPPWLPARMRRLATMTGIDVRDLLESLGESAIEGETWETRTEIPAGQDVRSGTASQLPAFTVVVVCEQGFVPPREEVRIDVPILKSEADKDPSFLGPVVGERVVCMRDGRCRYEPVEIGYWLSIAFPVYGPELFRPSPAWVEAEGVRAQTCVAAEIGELARAQLDREMPSILVRTAVRAILKYTAERQAEKVGGEVAGLVANIFGAASEQAETRTWLTLPLQVSMAVIDLETPIESCRVQWEDEGGLHEESVPVRRIEGSSFGIAGCRRWR